MYYWTGKPDVDAFEEVPHDKYDAHVCSWQVDRNQQRWKENLIAQGLPVPEEYR